MTIKWHNSCSVIGTVPATDPKNVRCCHCHCYYHSAEAVYAAGFKHAGVFLSDS